MRVAIFTDNDFGKVNGVTTTLRAGLPLLAPLTRYLGCAGVAHRLVLIGDGPMRSELQASCPEALFTGTLSSDEVAIAMASADVFLFPSRTDTAGNVVLEAQASGLPVLVSDAGGPCENLQAGRTGCVCGTLLEFARRASDLVRNASKRQQFGVAGWSGASETL